MRIPTTVQCPACGGDGTLELDVTTSKYFCVKGHEFTQAEIEGVVVTSVPGEPLPQVAADPAPQPPETSAPVAPAPAEVPSQPAPAEAATPVETLAPPPRFEPGPPQAPEASQAQATLQEKAVTTLLEAKSEASLAAAVAAAPFVPDVKLIKPEDLVTEPPKLQGFAMPNGGMFFVGFRIDERHVQLLSAEAEVQGKTIEEHFQEQVLYGLDNGWFG